MLAIFEVMIKALRGCVYILPTRRGATPLTLKW